MTLLWFPGCSWICVLKQSSTSASWTTETIGMWYYCACHMSLSPIITWHWTLFLHVFRFILLFCMCMHVVYVCIHTCVFACVRTMFTRVHACTGRPEVDFGGLSWLFSTLCISLGSLFRRSHVYVSLYWDFRKTPMLYTPRFYMDVKDLNFSNEFIQQALHSLEHLPMIVGF